MKPNMQEFNPNDSIHSRVVSTISPVAINNSVEDSSQAVPEQRPTFSQTEGNSTLRPPQKFSEVKYLSCPEGKDAKDGQKKLKDN